MTPQKYIWPIYTGKGIPQDNIQHIAPPPPWRQFGGETVEGFTIPEIEEDSRDAQRAKSYRPDITPPTTDPNTPPIVNPIEVVNSALVLRRPLLITGQPGMGKSSLAYSVAYELKLGPVLYWPISTRTTLADGLYRYDAIGRLQAGKAAELRGSVETADSIENFIALGPLGTALLPTNRPRVLLIDEIDKSDIDLPNDLLNLFEEGKFEIPELSRLPQGEDIKKVRLWKSEQRFPISRGQVECKEFPIIFMTSNGERDFPAPFLRRCLRLNILPPSPKRMEEIIDAHFANVQGVDTVALARMRDQLIAQFWQGANVGALATDQLLNAVYIAVRTDLTDAEKASLWKTLLRPLTSEA